MGKVVASAVVCEEWVGKMVENVEGGLAECEGACWMALGGWVVQRGWEYNYRRVPLIIGILNLVIWCSSRHFLSYHLPL